MLLASSYRPVIDNPYYHKACTVLIKTEPMNKREVLFCRKVCADCLRHIRNHGTKRQVNDFYYHMSWVSYPLRKRPNGSWL